MRTFEMEMEKSLAHILFSVHKIFFCTVLTGIYLGKNIPIRNGEELGPNVDKIMSTML
jgi:hypothetical protein